MSTPVSLFPVLVFENNGGGAPLANGTVSTYLAGTTTPQISYTDGTGGTSAGSVLTLNSNGQANNGAGVWLANGVNYKLVIADSHGATVQTIDNVAGGGFTGNSSFVTAATESSLIGSRTLTAGNSTNIVDNGAGSTIVVQRAALTGDVTASLDSNATTIAAGAVSLAKMANLAANSLIGNPTGGSTTPSAVTAGASLTISGSTISRAALTGDITASANSNATTIAPGVVTVAKMANIAANTVLGNATSGSATPVALTLQGLGMDGTSVLQNQIPLVTSSATPFTITASTNRGQIINLNGNSAVTVNLPSLSTVGTGWYCYIKNGNTGIATLTRNGSDTIGSSGVSTSQIYANQTAFLMGDSSSSNWKLTVLPSYNGLGYDFGTSNILLGNPIINGLVVTLPQTLAFGSSNQDNLAITSTVIKITASAGVNLTGIVPLGNGGQHVYLMNTSAFTITLKNLTTSTAANQFQLSTGADIALLTNQTMHLLYDDTASKWRNVL
jgi:hypothetical protein